MLDYYTVVISSDRYEEGYRDIKAESADAACSSAASFFFAEHPDASNVSIISVFRYYGDDFKQVEETSSSYTAYGSVCNESPADEVAPPSSGYTPYRAPSARPGTGYTPYSTATACCDRPAVEAGFTTVLPAAPVPETSYHQTLPNGYAPYRTCRVILPR